MTTAGGAATSGGNDVYYKNMMKNNKKANIHDIIKREINSKQAAQHMQQLGVGPH